MQTLYDNNACIWYIDESFASSLLGDFFFVHSYGRDLFFTNFGESNHGALYILRIDVHDFTHKIILHLFFPIHQSHYARIVQ